LSLQYFKENQFFTDNVLRKVYKYVPPAGAKNEKPDAEGITEAMLDFDWGTHVDMPVSNVPNLSIHCADLLIGHYDPLEGIRKSPYKSVSSRKC
jgi:hypothetical protein